MKKEFALIVSFAMAFTALAGCSDGGSKKKTKPKKVSKTSSIAETQEDEGGEEDYYKPGVLENFDDNSPSVINGLILESQSVWKNVDTIDTMAEEGFTKEPPLYEFELDEVFEMYLDTDVDDPWNVYIIRHDDELDVTTLDEDRLLELSEQDGCSNTLGNTPDREYHGDIGGMCVASDISTEGDYDMFFVRKGVIDSYIGLVIVAPAEDEI